MELDEKIQNKLSEEDRNQIMDKIDQMEYMEYLN